jgi:hypothetical protein
MLFRLTVIRAGNYWGLKVTLPFNTEISGDSFFE